MKKYLTNYIKENIRSIVILSICILIGIIVGTISFNFFSVDNKNEIIKGVQDTLDLTKQEGFTGINILMNGLLSNFYIISIMILATLTIIAPAIVCLIYLLKGFSIGIYIATIFSIFGFGNGILVFLLSVLIPNLIYIPIFIYIGVNAIGFHYEIMDTSKVGRIKVIVKQGYQLLISMSIILLSIIIEQSLIPVIFSIYSKI